MPDDNQSDTYNLTRRKILAGVGAIGLAGASAGLGTSAYFSDQETFTNNQLVAGELDMKVSWEEHYSDWSEDEAEYADMEDGELVIDDQQEFMNATLQEQFPDKRVKGLLDEGELAACEELADVPDDLEKPVIELTDVKPGDFGEITFDFALCDNPGFVWMTGRLLENAENDLTEPEAEDSDEDDAPGDETTTGELADALEVTIWHDDDCDNLKADSEGKIFSGSLRDGLARLADEAGLPIDSPSVETFSSSDANRGCFAPETRHCIGFKWELPVDHANELQSDSVRFDLGFYTEQCRHNDGSGRSDFPTDVAETFLEHYEVADDSLVFFGGPVQAGTVITDPLGAELQVPPDTPGTYYVFVVDKFPEAGFSHPTRLAWLDMESGTRRNSVAGSWWPQFSTTPRFEFPPEPTKVDGRTFLFGGEPAGDTQSVGTSVSAADDTDPISSPRFPDFDNGDDELVPIDDILPGDGDFRFDGIPSERDIKKDRIGERRKSNYALVIDGGNPPRLSGRVAARMELWGSRMMARWARETADWIENSHAEDNFNVHRISQHRLHKTPPDTIQSKKNDRYFESNLEAGGTVRAPSLAYRDLQNYFNWYAHAFTSGVDNPSEVNLHFVLVVVAHGDEHTEPSQNNGYFALANPRRTSNSANEWAWIPWRGGQSIDVKLPDPENEDETITRTISYTNGIKEWLELFPPYVGITVIAFSCYSGEALEALKGVADNIVTSANVDKISSAGSPQAFVNAGRRKLSAKYDAMVKQTLGEQRDLDGDGEPDKNEDEKRYEPKGSLGPLDR